MSRRGKRVLVPGLALAVAVVGLGPVTAAALTTASTITASKAAPQPPNTTITFTIAATGGTPPYETKWFLTRDNWRTFSVVQNWATGTSLSWTPTTEGGYNVAVWVRSAGNPADAPESGQTQVRQIAFTIGTICPPTQGVPPDQDVRRGQCLFNSSVAWGQANSTNMFASCNGCHPGGGTDRGTHPVLLTNSQGQQLMVPRQVPDLRNVTINLPLGWAGQHGGTPGDLASIKVAIRSASIGAITSPVEMAGKFDPNDPVDNDRMASLVAFLVSRSPMGPRPPETGTQPPMIDAGTLANIKRGADVFFGRTASTAPLLAQGKACVSCHPPPAFTDNQVRTNVLDPAAAFDFGFPGGPLDTGAAHFTGNPAQVGHFKTPSLHHFYPDAEPFMHNGIFGRESKLFQFYEKSLGFRLGSGESTGLHYWLQNCPKGIGRPLAAIPPECN